MKAVSAACSLVVVLAAPVTAAPADVANSVASKVMSPYCPGVTLHDCPSDNATALIARIEGLAREGYTESQIIDYLVAEWPGIRAAPPPSGVGLGAWAVPLLGALAGGAIAWRLLRKWIHSGTRPEGYDPDVHVTAADRKRLERELELFRGET